MAAFYPGDLIQVNAHMSFNVVSDGAREEFMKVRLTKSYEKDPDIPASTPGIILEQFLDNNDRLFVVFIKNVKAIIWKDNLTLVSRLRKE